MTDVVDSTRLVEELGDARAAELWAAHDRAARDLLAPHRGLEIDKTDGFLLLFDTVDDAAAYAVAYHAGLVRLSTTLGVPLAARAGLHFGPVVLRENPAADVARGAKPLEVEGIAKPTAARVMSVAGAGQTLMTSEARAHLALDLAVRSHGWWRMKGLEEPVELFEAGPEDAPFTPPADGAKVYRVVRDGEVWRPAREVPNNLPSPSDSFVGRAAELRALGRLLQGGGLVTLLGTGGTGKSRLSLEFGRRVLGDFPGGCWFIELEDVTAVDPLLAAIANGIGVQLAGKDPVAFLGALLNDRPPVLLILDNFEQLVTAGAPVLERLVAAAPGVGWIVSSRESLRIRGEQLFPLETLAPPPTDASIEAVRANAAVQLFAERASAGGRFSLTDGNAPHVAELVRLLDGLPLAIELAAARARVMSPKKLVQRMTRRFDLLAAGRRGARPRQATLRGAIDWSWDLLTPAERLALAQCSCFRGGFTMEAAEEVLDLEAVPDAPWPMDVVQSLMEKSLLRTWTPDPGPGAERAELSDPLFGMFVSIHEYATEKLLSPDAVPGSTGPEASAALHLRHAGYYADLEDAARQRDWLPDTEDLARIGLERENLALAFETALQAGDDELAARLLLPLIGLVIRRGPASAAVDRFLRIDTEAIDDLDLRDRTLTAVLVPLTQRGRHDIERQISQQLAVLRESRGDTAGALAARASEARAGLWSDPAAGNLRLRALRVEAEAAGLSDLVDQLDQSIAITASSPEETLRLLNRLAGTRDEAGIVATYNLGCVLMGLGRPEEARATAESVLAWGEAHGDRRFVMLGTNNLAQTWAMTEDWERATPLLRATLEMAEQLEDQRFVFGGPTTLLTLGELEEGAVAAARQRIDRGVAMQRALGDPLETAWALGSQAATRLASGEVAEARRLLEETESLVPGVRDQQTHQSCWINRTWRHLEEHEAGSD